MKLLVPVNGCNIIVNIAVASRHSMTITLTHDRTNAVRILISSGVQLNRTRPSDSSGCGNVALTRKSWSAWVVGSVAKFHDIFGLKYFHETFR